ncbi:hypothetical protein HYH03_015600 [Edaphochlamys debaryana]|uniref:DUF3456 domain-containing protein n=1 Tax=Edaphochlamys debaryana TaxID=47281 RepID=A0A835XKW4_9CHLO|nr:hypothetical protein HYH03_015600 [Edaphochlamys debaryana]|eukprot:KAG2485716.1 hypothetical protein HYH03_015600 [Edaphochlamys debaryana]
MRPLSIIVLVLALALGASAGGVLKKIEAPCTACKAVAAELQRRIEKEPVRNHVDLRHRLDKDGKRYGKIISYQSSELRAVELLDGLCGSMRDYGLVSPQGKKTKYWLKVKGEGSKSTDNVTRYSRDEEDARSKRLEAYCGTLVEEFEEELYEGIMKGGFDTQGVEPVLCRGIITPCPVVALGEAGAADGTAQEQGEAVEDDGSEADQSEPPESETRYIENMTIEPGPDGKIEL